MSINESIVEDAALEWFGELGYAVGHGPQLAPDEPAAELNRRRLFTPEISAKLHMNTKKITEVTRRNISDSLVLNKFNWSGRFEEHQFLARLYDLSAMPSTDRRYSSATKDIWKHRVMNSDWPHDWVFYDFRFNLINAPDEEFIRFLCEMLHPAVQSQTDEVERIRVLINEHLVKDGWELREQLSISGRPVFAAVRVVEVNAHANEAAKVVTQSIDSEYLSRQVTRMQSAIGSEPDVAIGTAKEFVETICKTILRERGLPLDPNEKMPRLVKQVAASLDLIPKKVGSHSKATETVKRLLSNLGSVSDGLAELRNLHGTGHGKDARTIGLELRHARLAVGTATTLAVFLWECHTAESHE